MLAGRGQALVKCTHCQWCVTVVFGHQCSIHQSKDGTKVPDSCGESREQLVCGVPSRLHSGTDPRVSGLKGWDFGGRGVRARPSC